VTVQLFDRCIRIEHQGSYWPPGALQQVDAVQSYHKSSSLAAELLAHIIPLVIKMPIGDVDKAVVPCPGTACAAAAASTGSVAPDETSPPWQVLFCGRELSPAFEFTKRAVQAAGCEHELQIIQCESGDVSQAIRNAHVAVPLMNRIDASVLSRAVNLRMILQFGVGLEGVDIAEVGFPCTWGCCMPQLSCLRACLRCAADVSRRD
jgi:hypothetical protein